MVAYFADIAKRTDKPLMMLTSPAARRSRSSSTSLARIAEAAPHFVGIKHALDDHGFVTQMLARLGPEFRVFVGLGVRVSR